MMKAAKPSSNTVANDIKQIKFFSLAAVILLLILFLAFFSTLPTGAYRYSVNTLGTTSDDSVMDLPPPTQTNTAGSIYATSTPTSASVYVDSVYKGLTPLLISKVSTGQHTLKLMKSGYSNYTVGINVSTVKTTTVNANLTLFPNGTDVDIPTLTFTLYQPVGGSSLANLTATDTGSGMSSLKLYQSINGGPYSYLDSFNCGGLRACSWARQVPNDNAGTYVYRGEAWDVSNNVNYAAKIKFTIIPTTGTSSTINIDAAHDITVNGMWLFQTTPSGSYESLGSKSCGTKTCNWTVTVTRNQTGTYTYKFLGYSTATQYLYQTATYAAPNVTTGSIYATSTPTSASVYVDSVYKGLTPLTITNVTIGSHTVKFTKSGYNDYTTSVSVSAGQTTNVSATLVQNLTDLTSPSLTFTLNPTNGSTSSANLTATDDIAMNSLNLYQSINGGAYTYLGNFNCYSLKHCSWKTSVTRNVTGTYTYRGAALDLSNNTAYKYLNATYP